MIVTFQVQLDPLDPHEFTENELDTMHGDLMEFMTKLEDFKQYMRGDMYVDKKQYVPYYLRGGRTT